jgi:hypothetical protein
MPHDLYHTQCALQEQCSLFTGQDSWQDLLDLLPANAFEQARQQGAFVRARGLRHPADLLRGLLTYVFCLGSFRQLGSWATCLGLCTNGARSWAKRTRQAADWLLWLLQALLVPTSAPETLALPADFGGRIHLLDATHLRTWKRTGDSRRLHISYDLLAQRIEEVLLTDQQTGEGLQHFQSRPGDIKVADSGYCRRARLIAEVEAGVGIVVRLHWSNTPMQREDGSPFDLSGWLTSLSEQGEQTVWIAAGGRRVALRLLALRLSEEAAKRAHRKRRRKARKNGTCNQALTIQVADWLLVLSNLPAAQWSAQQVLSLYRARWQIELLFKRIKQLVRLHRLRSAHLQSNQAVLAAVLVGWALVEQRAHRLRQQCPASASDQAPWSSWQVCAVLVQSLRTMLLGQWTWAHIQQHLEALRHLLTVPPQQRSHQESLICQQLSHLLTLAQS